MVFLFELRYSSCAATVKGCWYFRLLYKMYTSSSEKIDLCAFYPRLEFSESVSTAGNKNSVVNDLFCKTRKLPEYNMKLKPNLKQTLTALEFTCLDI